MSEIIKQSMSNIWASAGDIVAPDSVKIADGWLVEVVPRQYWNWMQNRTDTNLAYLFQHGIPEWDSTVEYIVNKSYVQYSDVVYKALLTGVNKLPTSNPTYWKIAFATSTSALEALKSVTPAANKLPYFTSGSAATTTDLSAFARTILDDADAATVRTTIGAQPLDAILTAVAGLTTATNKLPYFSGVNTASVTDLSAFGRSLIDDSDATAARSTLGLGTAATSNITTSPLDSTAGRLVRVGDFGLGAALNLSGQDLNDTSLETGMYYCVSPMNGPGANGHLWQHRRSGTVIGQHYVTANNVNPKTYFRSMNGTWSVWVETWTSLNFNLVDTQAQIDSKAPLNSPPLTGVPTAPTAVAGTNTTQLATTAFVNAEIANDAPTKTGGGASGTWGIAISGNAASATTLTSLTASVAELNYVNGVTSAIQTQLDAKAPKASPTFTGTTSYASLGLGATAVNINTITGNGVITNVSASTTGTFNSFQAKTGSLITYVNGARRWQLHNPGAGYLWFRDYNGSAWTAWTTFVPADSVNLTGGSVSFSGSGSVDILRNLSGLTVTRNSVGNYTVNGLLGLQNNQPGVAISNNGRVIQSVAAGSGGIGFITCPYNTATPTDSPYVSVILGV